MLQLILHTIINVSHLFFGDNNVHQVALRVHLTDMGTIILYVSGSNNLCVLENLHIIDGVYVIGGV